MNIKDTQSLITQIEAGIDEIPIVTNSDEAVALALMALVNQVRALRLEVSITNRHLDYIDSSVNVISSKV